MSVADDLDPMISLWHWLAYDLRRYRVNAKMSQPQLGRLLGIARQTVCNIEANVRKLTDKQAVLLDERWNTGGHFLRLLTFARLDHDPAWFKEHIQYEARATVLKIFELAMVPGLLQTEAYIRASLMSGGVRDLEKHIATRLARQKALTRTDPPLLWALLDQSVILRNVGNRTIMREQLEHLLMISELPHVKLRIVPFASGSHHGLEGSFKIMTVDNADIAYTDAAGAGRLVLDSAEARNYAVRYDWIGAQALPEVHSRSLIRHAMEAMK